LQGELSAASERVAKANAEVDRLNGKSMPPSPETVFDHQNDSALTQELGAVFDKAEAREERKPEMPSVDGESLSARVERSYEWNNETSKAEQRRDSDAAEALAETRKIAAKFNLSLQEAEAVKQTQLLQENQQQANDYAPVAQHLKSAFRDSTPAEAAAFFAQTKAGLDRDLIGGIAEIAQHYGAHPMHVAQMIAQRFGGQRGQQPTQEMMNALTHTVNQTAASLDRFEDHQEEILGIIQKNEIKRSGNHEQDLRRAYDLAVRRESRLTADQRLQKRLERVYDKAQRGRK
jgi:hypothetical protein